MFGTQALRLLRTFWKGSNALAQEIYAILSNATLPLEHSGPITLNVPASGEPPLTLKAGSGDLVPLRIQRGDDSYDFSFSEDGTLNLPGQAQSAAGGTSSSSTSGGGAAGTVVSGSGTSYRVRLTTGVTVDATQLQIADGESVPAGAGVLLAVVGGVYYMQYPVWN